MRKLKKKKTFYRRKWARFLVRDEDVLRGKILEGHDRMSKLRSLSLGGCSFLSRRGDARLLLNPEVQVQMTIAGKNFTLKGVVHYCQFMPQLGLDQNLVGIEFVWPNDDTQKEFGMLIGQAVNQGCLEQMSNVEV